MADTFSVICNQTADRNPLSNDSDPDGNLPLAILSVTITAGDADAVLLNPTTVQLIGAIAPGTTTATYVLSDSLGAQATGNLTINTTGTSAQCNA